MQKKFQKKFEFFSKKEIFNSKTAPYQGNSKYEHKNFSNKRQL